MVSTAKTLEKNKAVNVVYNFFNQFKTWFSRSTPPTIDEIEKFLTKNFQMINNGRIVSKNSADYLERLLKFKKKYIKFEISEPLEEPLVVNNQLAIYYNINLTTQDGQIRQVFLIGLGTIEGDRINRWVEVTNEKGGGTWDT